MNSIRSDRLELVSMSPNFLDALLNGRRTETGLEIPEDWPDAHDRRFLELRLRQLRQSPELQPWLVYAVVLPERRMIGHAGFHGPPGINALEAADAVEVGYTIFPTFRRRGYASEAARALIEWASVSDGIRRFLASVAPENAPSLALVRKLGFTQIGRHWDEEDGEELEFELRLSGGA
jgi:RimJ/RimL family protein N-acetyltransferase